MNSFATHIHHLARWNRSFASFHTPGTLFISATRVYTPRCLYPGRRRPCWFGRNMLQPWKTNFRCLAPGSSLKPRPRSVSSPFLPHSEWIGAIHSTVNWRCDFAPLSCRAISHKNHCSIQYTIIPSFRKQSALPNQRAESPAEQMKPWHW